MLTPLDSGTPGSSQNGREAWRGLGGSQRELHWPFCSGDPESWGVNEGDVGDGTWRSHEHRCVVGIPLPHF